MGVYLIRHNDTSYLNSLLLRDGTLIPVSYAALKDFSQEDLSAFCVQQGIYQIITHELVGFIQNEIGGATAIEIGAGNGCLGSNLRIPITDNCMQDWQEIKEFYRQLDQPCVKYHPNILRMDAETAIQQFKPSVVVASWVTEKYRPYAISKKSSVYGVDEKEFKGRIEKYIHIGNDAVHGDKEILKIFPVKRIKFPWLISRSPMREHNVIYIFDCR